MTATPILPAAPAASTPASAPANARGADASGGPSFDDALKNAGQPPAAHDRSGAPDGQKAGAGHADAADGADGAKKAGDTDKADAATAEDAAADASSMPWLDQWAAYATPTTAADAAQNTDGASAGTVDDASAVTDALAGGASRRGAGNAPPAAAGALQLDDQAAGNRPGADPAGSGRVDAAADGAGAGARNGADLAPASFADVLRRDDGPAGAAAHAAASTPDALAAAGALPPAAESAARAPAPATVPGPAATLHGPALQARLDDALRWMAGNGVQHAQIRVEPDALGPITVHLRIEGDVANVAFTSAHETTRHALEASLPGLRDALAAGGLSLGQASVGAERHPQGSAADSSADRQAGQRQPDDADAQRAGIVSGTSAAPPVARPAAQRGGGLLSLYA
ncbi:hypothetical protein GCM10023144_44260 [Pigmentiphaga soli]|uniref:Flagellar hook-length control protein-like C-terminal domain-containing protein n=1 Tax=Pigmentiphaga soli TaxID=1007095 RepID=A0ABP8HPQ1_9BURK